MNTHSLIDKSESEQGTWKSFLNAMLAFSLQQQKEDSNSYIVSDGLFVFLQFPTSSSVSLFTIDESFEFHHSNSIPEDIEIQKIFDLLVNDGIVGLALSTKALTYHSNDDSSGHVLLIPLLVPSGIMGIVLMRLEQSAETIEQMMLQLCQLHANQFSYLLKNANLVQRLKQSYALLEQKVAARTLSIDQSRRDLRTIIECVSTGILIIDAQTKEIIDVNSAALELMGATKEQVYGSNSSSFLTPIDDRFPASSDNADIYSPTYIKNFESLLFNTSGESLPILRTVSPAMLGNQQCLIESFVDITERKLAEQELQQVNELLELKVQDRTIELENLVHQLQKQISEREQAQKALLQSEDRLRSIIENTLIGIVITNAGGYYEYVNPAFCNLVGVPIHHILDKHFTIFAPTIQKPELQQRHAAILTGEVLSAIEYPIICSDSNTKTVIEDSIRIIGVDGLPKCASFVLDISERKRVEEEIRKLFDREKELSQLKTNFITTVSHEFRTPLAIILSSIELIQLYNERFSFEQKNNYYKRIIKSVDKMTMLLEGILFIGKADSQKMEYNPHPLYLPYFCEDIVADIRLSHNDRTLNFSLTGEHLHLNTDERLLGQILTNLLTNSLKYSPETEPIEFHVYCFEHEILFKIIDYGIGIPLEKQQHLFEPFYRGTNVGNIPGTGLGLSIVKRAVDILGGKITFKTEENVGTSFSITFPQTSLPEFI